MPELELLFVPLGGAGEIGLNLNLYQLDGQWLMVDLGLCFADETLPGVEIVLPDPTFIAERRENLAGLVLTNWRCAAIRLRPGLVELQLHWLKVGGFAS